MFLEAAEKKIEDTQEKPAWLIDLTITEAKELAKTFILDRPKYGFANAMKYLENQYGNPHRLLVPYRKGIKQMTKINSGDAAAYRMPFTSILNHLIS